MGLVPNIASDSKFQSLTDLAAFQRTRGGGVFYLSWSGILALRTERKPTTSFFYVLRNKTKFKNSKYIKFILSHYFTNHRELYSLEKI